MSGLLHGPHEAVPELEFDAPYCSRWGCDAQTIPDDGYYCPECGAHWDWDGRGGWRDVEEAA